MLWRKIIRDLLLWSESTKITMIQPKRGLRCWKSRMSYWKGRWLTLRSSYWKKSPRFRRETSRSRRWNFNSISRSFNLIARLRQARLINALQTIFRAMPTRKPLNCTKKFSICSRGWISKKRIAFRKSNWSKAFKSKFRKWSISQRRRKTYSTRKIPISNSCWKNTRKTCRTFRLNTILWRLIKNRPKTNLMKREAFNLSTYSIRKPKIKPYPSKRMRWNF